MYSKINRVNGTESTRQAMRPWTCQPDYPGKGNSYFLLLSELSISVPQNCPGFTQATENTLLIIINWIMSFEILALSHVADKLSSTLS